MKLLLSPRMSCPRCGQVEVETEACPRCGVVVAKYRDPAQRPRSLERAAQAPAHSLPVWLWLVLLVVVLAVSIAVRERLQPAEHGSARPTALVPRTAPVTLPAREEGSPALDLPATAVAPPALQEDLQNVASLTDQDHQIAGALAIRLNQQSPLSEESLRSAEGLAARHPAEPALRSLVAAVHVRLATQDRGGRRYDAARAHIQRASEDPAVAPQALALSIAIAFETGDWAGGEAAARQLLDRKPGDAPAQRGLGYALFRQDRNREAAQVLQTLLETRDDGEARALLQRIRKTADDEQGMTEQRLAHFNVRYDGATHEDVGREILRALERHFATLTVTLDHQMATAVPVILFSDQDYYLANGMPSWVGGHYDSSDGRIRIPIRGLSSSLSPELDGTLIHELTHAFIGDRTRGQAPREIHEGLAQYMEGKRVAQMLTPEHLAALAQGRVQGVAGFYLEALAFVEYLLRQRGQGGMNDLLQAIGATGNVDAAFQQVYGHDFRRTQAEWRQRFRQGEG